MTYPPPHHLLWDLGLTFEHGSDGSTSRAWMPVVPEVCGTDGNLRAGALTTLVDVISGGLAAIAAQPNWIATADLTMHLLRGVRTGTVEARARVLRAGRTTVVLEVDVVDDAEQPVAVATTSFAVLPRRDTNPDIGKARDGGGGGLAAGPPPDAGLTRPYLDQLGVEVIDGPAGIVEVPVTDWARNSMGAFQGGAVGAVIEAAAGVALAPLVVTDLHLSYLSFGREGPLRTRTTVHALGADRGVAHVELYDTGAQARTMTLARVTASRSLSWK